MKDRTLYGCFTSIAIAGALAVACTPAPAADIAYANNSIGFIGVTDEPCEDQSLAREARINSFRSYYKNHSDGSSLAGCYYLSKEQVHIFWATGKYYKYPINVFTAVTTKPSKGASI